MSNPAPKQPAKNPSARVPTKGPPGKGPIPSPAPLKSGGAAKQGGASKPGGAPNPTPQKPSGTPARVPTSSAKKPANPPSQKSSSLVKPKAPDEQADAESVTSGVSDSLSSPLDDSSSPLKPSAEPRKPAAKVIKKSEVKAKGDAAASSTGPMAASITNNQLENEQKERIKNWLNLVNTFRMNPTPDSFKTLVGSFQVNVQKYRFWEMENLRESILLVHIILFHQIFNAMTEYGRFVYTPQQKQILETDVFKNKGTSYLQKIKNDLEKKRYAAYTKYEQAHVNYEQFIALVQKEAEAKGGIFRFFEEDIIVSGQEEYLLDAASSLIALSPFL